MGLGHPSSWTTTTTGVEWRKNYRVWEANRGVLPENWIYPELRDGKSPFFKELESELLQDEITHENVERAYLNYLEKLNEVARLEIAGLYYEADGATGRPGDTAEILHVFGRTPNTPHRYFYRRWIGRSYWTPWERVELDIEGDHLIPVVWNRRLYLFWPLFTEKALGSGDSQIKYWEIRLAWSNHDVRRWAPKRVSEVWIDTRWASVEPSQLRGHQDRRRYFFAALPGQTLRIRANVSVGIGWFKDVADFEIGGCDDRVELKPFQGYESDRTEAPSVVYLRTDGVCRNPPQHMRFVETGVDEALYLRPLVLVQVTLETPGLGSFGLILPTGLAVREPFAYEDESRTFVVEANEPLSLPFYYGFGNDVPPTPIEFELPKRFRFHAAYHPYVCSFITAVRRFGISGLLAPSAEVDAEVARELEADVPHLRRQELHDAFFHQDYGPTDNVDRRHPVDEIEFSSQGGYSLYSGSCSFTRRC
jgi:hypothetical protein